MPTHDRAQVADELAELFVHHRATLTAQARRMLREQADVEDVVQEAFLRLLLALPELEGDRQVLAYSRRTVRNLCIDRYRADERRPPTVELDGVDVAEPESDVLVRAEEAALVQAALERLTPLHRAALLKRVVEEKPLPVVAAELGVAEDSVKHLLHRARRAMRRLLQGTHLVPGANPEQSLACLTGRSGGRAAAAILLLTLLVLGSGPDLRVLPVVGKDLPDLPSIADLVAPVLPMPHPVPGAGVRLRSAPLPRSPLSAAGPMMEPVLRPVAQTVAVAGLPPARAVMVRSRVAAVGPSTSATASVTSSPRPRPDVVLALPSPDPAADPTAHPTAQPSVAPSSEPNGLGLTPAGASPRPSPDPGARSSGGGAATTGEQSGGAQPRSTASPSSEPSAGPSSEPSAEPSGAAPAAPQPSPEPERAAPAGSAAAAERQRNASVRRAGDT